MTTGEKIEFLKKGFIPMLKNADANALPRWGKMNFIQMVEHLTYTFDIASGKISSTAPEETEKIGKMRAWLMTEKPFRENTINPLMSETPDPVKHHTAAAAIGNLQMSLLDFFARFEEQPDDILPNPVFGLMNFEEQIRLAYKHTTHHLRQFGLAHFIKAERTGIS